jgi:hypothetical protein
VVDSDSTYPANIGQELLRPIIENKYDMVVGDRLSNGSYKKTNQRYLHGFGNYLVGNLVNFLFRAKLSDIMSGYRALSRNLVKNYPLVVGGFEIETDLTVFALQRRFRILEIPTTYRDRPAGSFSKLHTIKDGLRILMTISHIFRHYKPLLFFGYLSIVFFFCGLCAGLPVIYEFIETAYIKRVPLAILASGLMIISIILASIGLVLDAIARQNSINFESNYMLHKYLK